MFECTLENGIKILCYPIPHAYSLTVGLYVKAGLKYELSEQYGISHFLEHMHFRGTGIHEQKNLYNLTQKMGTSLVGKTYKELLQFQMKVRPKYIFEACGVIKTVIDNYSWTQEQLEAERKIILEEIAEKSFYLNINTCVDELLWPEQLISKDILGSEKSIKQISLQDLIQYKKSRFVPGNICIVITGAIVNEDFLKIKSIFEQIKLNSLKELLINQSDKTMKIRKPDIKFNYCEWNCLDVCLIFDVDYSEIKIEELLLLNSILGDGDGSKLQNILKEKNGYSYNIYSEIYSHIDSLELCIHFSIKKKNIYKGIYLIIQTIREMKTRISELDMMLNKPFYIDNLWFDLENTQKLNDQIGWEVFILNYKMCTIEEKIKKFDNITKEDIMRAANTIFRPKNTSIAVLGNTEKLKKEKIRKVVIKELS